MLRRVAMRSRQIRSVAYDDSQQLLEVALTNGEVRRYPQAPRYLFLGLLSARSPSKFFSEIVEERQFEAAFGQDDEAGSSTRRRRSGTDAAHSS